MLFKFKLPTTPSKRHLIQLNTFYLKKTPPLIKKKLQGLTKSTGRNNSGKITINHKGSGKKTRYRIINFNRTKDSTGIICSVEYDPNRNSHIASVFDFLGDFYYILCPKGVYIGDIVKSGNDAEYRIGHALPISKIPIGSYLHNISIKPNKRAQVSLSAGTFSKLKEKSFSHAIIELSSKKEITISPNCIATLGIVSNGFYFLTQWGKAGNSRWLNKRPTVRGVAMNPVDHPNGGGEGKTSSKRRTPWGKSTRSKK